MLHDILPGAVWTHLKLRSVRCRLLACSASFCGRFWNLCEVTSAQHNSSFGWQVSSQAQGLPRRREASLTIRQPDVTACRASGASAPPAYSCPARSVILAMRHNSALPEEVRGQ